METTINLNLSEDFSALCCIYQIQPDMFLQTVVDQISFPSYYSNPMGNDRWATFCFLNFLQEEESKYQVDEEMEDRYMSQLEASINFSLTTDADEISESFESVRSIMRQWLKAVLTQRSRYLTDTL
jgi:hypothetical protein